MSELFYGLWPICRKEFTHIVRDPGTLFFAILIPLIQLFLFGFAVDTNVRQIPTAVLDESHTQESRQLLQSFAASDVFRPSLTVLSDSEMNTALRAGKVRVGIKIPYDYARRLQNGASATVLLLVDGSDANVAGQAVNASTGVALTQSLAPFCLATPGCQSKSVR
jgi:ABC-2 type transport system permease protein